MPRYQDGKLVDLRGFAGPVYLLGDIHAKLSRLRAALELTALEPELASGRAVLLLLGDLFHREEQERSQEMESSVETLHAFLALQERYPDHLYCLLGNHEFTRSRTFGKHGVAQGLLFGNALEEKGLRDVYERFLQASPLAAVHTHFAATHAAPARSLTSLDELKGLPVEDVSLEDFHPAVREMTHNRHRNFDRSGRSAYSDHDVEDFLALCGLPRGLLLAGHTPLSRDCDWTWRMGPRNHVIFAAGRELGTVRADRDGLRFVRLGRSEQNDDDRIVPHRAGPDPIELDLSPTDLAVDGDYRILYGRRSVELLWGSECASLCHFQQLPYHLQAYFSQGFYLYVPARRPQVVRLPIRDAVTLVGEDGREAFILSHGEPGSFRLRPLREDLQLR